MTEIMILFLKSDHRLKCDRTLFSQIKQRQKPAKEKSLAWNDAVLQSPSQYKIKPKTRNQTAKTNQ